jgi:hypothetical protein
MKKTYSIFILLLAMVFLTAACSGGASQPESQTENTAPAEEASMESENDSEMMEGEGDSEPMEEPHMEDEMNEIKEDPQMENEPEDMEQHESGSESGDMATDNAMEGMDLPAYFNVPLTNPATGQSFTIADEFKDQVVLVETLAMWCSNCLKQQNEVKRLHDLIGERDDFRSLGLDIDPNETLPDLQSYVERNGFDWTYAVSPVEVSREIDQLYGTQFLNPPSTPMFIIDKSGDVHLLPFGIKSAEELQAALEPFLN